jgi:hypothetical protein
MRKLARRFLVIAAFAFWQGGFTFYAGVVVPVGQDILNSPSDQALVTRQVTNYLNLAGIIALIILACDQGRLRTDDRSMYLRWAAWLGMAVCLVLLVWLHRYLDGLLDPEDSRILNRHAFRRSHRLYLWTSTFQWIFGLIYLVGMVRSWQREDKAGA